MGQGTGMRRGRVARPTIALLGLLALTACTAPSDDEGSFRDSLRSTTTTGADRASTTTTDAPTTTTVTLPPTTAAPTTTTTAPPPPPPGPSIPAGDDAEVTRVTDGDTIVVNGSTRVRLIGVDTPEVAIFGRDPQCYGPDASGWTKGALPPGTRVRLEYDNNRTDRYGRTLAYVYRLADGLNVQVALLQLGLAAAYPFADTPRHSAWFADEARRAKAAGVGGWATCAGSDGPLAGPAVK